MHTWRTMQGFLLSKSTLRVATFYDRVCVCVCVFQIDVCCVRLSFQASSVTKTCHTLCGEVGYRILSRCTFEGHMKLKWTLLALWGLLSALSVHAIPNCYFVFLISNQISRIFFVRLVLHNSYVSAIFYDPINYRWI